MEDSKQDYLRKSLMAPVAAAGPFYAISTFTKGNAVKAKE
jgi:hypothetical protein